MAHASLLSSSSSSASASGFQKHLNRFVRYTKARMDGVCLPLVYETLRNGCCLKFLLLLLEDIFVEIFGPTHKSERPKIYAAT